MTPQALSSLLCASSCCSSTRSASCSFSSAIKRSSLDRSLQAKVSGVRPDWSVAVWSASACRRISMRLGSSFTVARWSAVVPSRALAFTSAACLTRSCTKPAWPQLVAWWIADQSRSSRAWTLARERISKDATDSWPPFAALCNGVSVPCSPNCEVSARFTSPPKSKNFWTISRSPMNAPRWTSTGHSDRLECRLFSGGESLAVDFPDVLRRYAGVSRWATLAHTSQTLTGSLMHSPGNGAREGVQTEQNTPPHLRQ
eukprot:CAMPEP_0114558446 /NCGR_PEP_ID=MMETSP0114-20121206/10388_1 /TAXON_ID=31324 /ORGANISM="Goniomonas sp, Strain m" /LENGTH=256 /DNA_ID=CAMNT_0001743841 /DNA_START=295 /DNA_END=1065 /DNA_ORIENTATION=+